MPAAPDRSRFPSLEECGVPKHKYHFGPSGRQGAGMGEDGRRREPKRGKLLQGSKEVCDFEPQAVLTVAANCDW